MFQHTGIRSTTTSVKTMIASRTWAAALALVAVAVITPVDANLLRGSGAHAMATAGNNTVKTKAATAIDAFQALTKTKVPWGLYDAADWSAANGKLLEASANGKDVVSAGTIKFGSGIGNGAKGNVTFILGSTSSRLVWPEGSIPTKFTICSITRYTGGSNERILRSVAGNWLHGHHENTVGVAFYDGWKTPENPPEQPTDWAVMCGSNGLPTPTNILYNGSPVGIQSGGSSPNPLAINPANPAISSGQVSNWALSFVAIWDQHLTAAEIKMASDALMEYLASGRSLTKAAAAGATSSSGISNVVTSDINADSSTVTTTTFTPSGNTTITTITTPTNVSTTITTTTTIPKSK